VVAGDVALVSAIITATSSLRVKRMEAETLWVIEDDKNEHMRRAAREKNSWTLGQSVRGHSRRCGRAGARAAADDAKHLGGDN
jgi:hypothetical protein